MHNSYAKYVKIFDICKTFFQNLVNEPGNVPRRTEATNIRENGRRVCESSNRLIFQSDYS